MMPSPAGPPAEYSPSSYSPANPSPAAWLSPDAQRDADSARLTLVAHASASYPPRTRHNADTADLTLAFAVDFGTAGETLTHKLARPRYEAVPLTLDIDPVLTARTVYRYVALQRHAYVLNIAGNSLPTLVAHGITQAAVNCWLYGVLAPVHQHHPFARILSGGQTGVDTAGLVVALALGIPATGTLPKHFLRRSAEGVDFETSEPALRAELLAQVQTLRADLALPQHSSSR